MSLAEDKQIYGCFIDFRKAFDNIDRYSLWYKLLKFCIKGKMHYAIKSLYENVKCSIKLDGGNVFTDMFPVSLGLKQGCKISPTMFNIYINDLCAELNTIGKGIKVGDDYVSLLMYADDIILMSNTARGLQSLLDCLDNWCRKWNMHINENKTKVVHFKEKENETNKLSFQMWRKMYWCNS